MIGLDTNVLLRAFVNDHPEQSSRARALLAEPDGRSFFVCLTVLIEFAWTLRRTYGYSAQSVILAIRRLLEASDTTVERRELVERCLVECESKRADLADLVIALGNRDMGCSHTVTFDRTAAKRVESMELIA